MSYYKCKHTIGRQGYFFEPKEYFELLTGNPFALFQKIDELRIVG